MKTENHEQWLERVEKLIQVLEGSSIGELELAEGELRLRLNAIQVWYWSLPLPSPDW